LELLDLLELVGLLAAAAAELTNQEELVDLVVDLVDHMLVVRMVPEQVETLKPPLQHNLLVAAVVVPVAQMDLLLVVEAMEDLESL